MSETQSGATIVWSVQLPHNAYVTRFFTDWPIFRYAWEYYLLRKFKFRYT